MRLVLLTIVLACAAMAGVIKLFWPKEFDESMRAMKRAMREPTKANIRALFLEEDLEETTRAMKQAARDPEGGRPYRPVHHRSPRGVPRPRMSSPTCSIRSWVRSGGTHVPTRAPIDQPIDREARDDVQGVQ